MGFLSGVLQAVKDENEVTTYDNYITTNNLDSVLNLVGSKIGSGRKGLVDAVEKVKGWLEGYFDHMKTLTANVLDDQGALNKLEHQVQNNIDALARLTKVDAYDENVAAWSSTVTKVMSTKLNDLGVAIDALDVTVRGKIRSHFDKIRMQVKNIETIAVQDQQELYSLGSDVQSMLMDLQCTLIDQMEKHKNECMGALKIEFQTNIQDPIKAVQRALQLVQKDMQSWSEKAKSIVYVALDKCESMLLKLQNTTNGYKPVSDAAQRLKGKAVKLMSAIEIAKETLQSKIIEAQEKVEELHTGLKKDLGEVRKKIKNGIGNVIKNLGVKQLKSDVIHGLERLKKNIENVTEGVNEDKAGGKSVVGDKLQALKDAMEQLTDVTGAITSTSQSLKIQYELFKTQFVDVSEGADGINSFDIVEKLEILSGDLQAHINKLAEIKDITPATSESSEDIPTLISEMNKYMQKITDRYSYALNVGNSGHYVQKTEYKSALEHAAGVINVLGKKLSIEVSNARDKIHGYKDDRDLTEAISKLKKLQSLKSIVYGASGNSFKDAEADSLARLITDLITAINGSDGDDVADGLGKLDQAVNDFNDQAVSQIRHAANDAIKNALGKFGDDDIMLGPSLMEQFNNTYREIETKLETQLKENVDAELPGEAFTSHEASLTKLHNYGTSHNGAKSDVDKAIRDIGVEVQTNLNVKDPDDVDGIIQMEHKTITNAFESITSALKQFADAVQSLVTDSVESGAKDKLNELNAMIGRRSEHGFNNGLTEGLEDIKISIFKILNVKHDGNLSSIIEQTEIFTEKTIEYHVAKCVRGIADFFTTEVDSKIKTIKHNALQRYVAATTTQLWKLKDYVMQTHTDMRNITNLDKRTGLKGFLGKLMNSMKKCSLTPIQPQDPPSKTVRGLAYKFMEFSRDHLQNLKQQEDLAEYPSAMYRLMESLDACVVCLYEKNHFDVDVSDKLQKFSKVIDKFSPETMDGAPKTVLTPLKKGFGIFIKELDKAYVSTYSGETFNGNLVETKTAADGRTTGKLTAYGTKCAKACLTLLSILCDDLNTLQNISVTVSRSDKLNRSTTLGEFFADHGYKVSHKDKHNGELRDDVTMLGFHINKKLVIGIKGADSNSHLKTCKDNEYTEQDDKVNTPVTKSSFSLIGVFDCLLRHIHQYYSVCHLSVSASRKHPTSIYDMLQWLIGLTHNPVHQQLALNGFSQLFEKPKTAGSGDNPQDGLSVKLIDDDTLDAYPKKITAMGLPDTLTAVSHYSYETLAAILGHGHAGGIYACDYNTNPQGFLYPTDFNAFVCMLLDMLNRLHEQLYFLYQQCSYTTHLSGWADCWYGNQVGGSTWRCNTMQCPDQSADQIHNQTCDQKCNQTAECGIKSPLQSFLEDGLPGFLPHLLKSNNGKLECTVKNHSGGPCKTPMGFADLSVMASHRQKGRYIWDILYKFCGNVHSPLTKMCCHLNCLLPSAPKTFSHMFSFYYHLLNGWEKQSDKHRKQAFDSAVTDAYFNAAYDLNDVSLLFKSKRHAAILRVTENEVGTLYHHCGNLYSIYYPDEECYIPGRTCGAYISPLCQEAYSSLTSENKNAYLSWMLYCTETFFDLACQLCKKLDDKCAAKNRKCRIMGCINGRCDVAIADSHEKKSHNKSCNSIVQCSNTLPTLYSYGLTFGNRVALNGNVGNKSVPKKTCNDLIQQLSRVCSNKSVLAKLIHETIPEFLFKIRAPFIWLNVALWLLSLLYLTHIMVIRLDLLHIKSHLHSPSSHRIAAQSLLAAGRVNKLNRVFYLQP